MSQGSVTIETRHGSEAENGARDLLLGLIDEFDLDRYTFTTRVLVDETPLRTAIRF